MCAPMVFKKEKESINDVTKKEFTDMHDELRFLEAFCLEEERMVSEHARTYCEF